MTRPKLRVLLIEDNEDDAVLIEAVLSEQYDVTLSRVQSGDEMSSALQESDWDIIISDHNLPAFSATEALRLAVDSGRDLPFIIVSGTIGEELAVEAMKAGAHDFVMKDALGKLAPAVEHAVAAGESRRLHSQAVEELRQSREQLRLLAGHLEQVREEERASLAREIHDELGGILTALKMDISWLRRRSDSMEANITDKLSSMASLADGAIQSMRRIITDLRPAILDDLGLIAAIEWQLDEFRKRTGLKVEFELSGDPETVVGDFPPAFSVTVFRILQEALTNIMRHAGAGTVTVGAATEGNEFVLTVADDGRGIADDNLLKRGSYGVLGMRERALGLGGSFDIRLRPEGGTLLALRLALPQRHP